MANPGVGNRFTSVNLNKSYGQSLHSNQSNSSNYGLGRGSRPAGGASGGGMVVLSRPKSSHKPGAKLSVPPPLNLPSIRKEHERFDLLGSGSGSAGGGVAGSGARPSSSGLGWSKPSAIVGGEKESADGDANGDRPLSSEDVDHGLQRVDGVNRGGGSTAYMPPSARTDVPVTMPRAVERTTVLRGEDFPSLRATLNAANGPTQKQKDSGHLQKHRQGMREELSGGQKEGSNLSSHVDMRPQVQSSQHSVSSGVGIHGREHRSSANSRTVEQWRKQDDVFPGPLPLVRLNPRSDWADDERDTSHGLADRSRDHGFSRTEAYWDRDFDLPRSSLPPLKPAQNLYDKRGQRDNDVGKVLSNEVSNADPFSGDARMPSTEGLEGHSWRTLGSRDRFGSQDVNAKSSFGARSTTVNREASKDNKYMPPQYGGNTRDENNIGPTANRDTVIGRRDHGRQPWNSSSDLNNGRGSERNVRDTHGNDSNRFKVNVVQNNSGSRSSFSPGNKGLSVSDHLSNFGRDKRSSTRNEKPYVEDPFSGFDGQDPFPGSVLGVVKRKKDANKQLDFHDPVRESFEAELERVQKIQEQERQRIIQEQERALEMVRREEEERQRVAREQEERQRRLAEEAREAAWRAEQERLESIQRAEEQRRAREEERQRMLMEEERRKQAAKQKLQELEERIAKRQTEARKSNSSATTGDIMPGTAKERDVSRADDFASWEDGERMVERITNSASSDSSLSRPFELESKAVSAREGSFALTDRRKSFNSWRQDMFENGNSSSFFSADYENGHQSPRREVSVGGRSFPRKDFYGGQGYMPTRGYYRGIPDAHMDDFPHSRGHRWNISADGDQYARNTELEADFPDNVADRFDLSWGQGRGRGNSPFPERYYQNADLEELYTYGRSRYPARQPRVLPPPSLPSVHRTSFRGENEHPDTSAYEDANIQMNPPLRNDSSGESFQIAQQEHLESLDASGQSATNGEQELNRSTTPGRDSQSSLSVSSPPSSPTHLSHDDLDDSRESVTLTGRTESQGISLSENEAVLSNAQVVKGNTMTTASSESVGDDEEWTIENNEELQEQEEYDEDVGYHEDDEVHEGDDENVELNREFDDMHLEGEDSPEMDNLVLGFDQGVEVGMPSEDYEKSPRVDESLFVGSQAAVSIVEQRESFDSSRDGLSSLAADVAQLVSTDASSVMVQETQKVVEPTSTSMSLDSLNAADSAPGTVLNSQQLVSSSGGTNTLSSNQSSPNIAGTQGPSDFPVKLQFGLFSGPSLIPSPVPAIQIGSIQMPLQLHPQIGPSLTHMHAPQPPLFQFGQLRYPSPISQGILPLAPQSMSYVQPNVPPIYSSSQVHGCPPSSLPVQDSSHNSVKDDALSTTMKNHYVQLPYQMNGPQDTESKKAHLLVTSSAGTNALLSQNQDGLSNMNQLRAELSQPVDSLGRPINIVRNSKPLLSNKASENRVGPSSHSVANVKDLSGPSAQGQNSGSRGRRFAFTARKSGARLSSSANETYRSDTNGFQRKPRRGQQRYEFRVRQTFDGKQSSVLSSSSVSGLDGKLNSDGKITGTLLKSVLNKELPSDKQEQTIDSEILNSDQAIAQGSGSRIEEDKAAQSESTATSGQDTSQRTEGSLKRNIGLEDVDTPLQSGVVRVFKQSGIEAPSDEDDFIEVRSKRQMLNDRREQREKEIKAKSSNMRKAQRKSRPAAQGAATRSTGRTTASSTQGTKNLRSTVLARRGLVNNEVSATLNNAVPQSLAPIGTPVDADCQNDGKTPYLKPPQTNSYAISGRTDGPDATHLAFDVQRKVADVAQSSLGSWSSSSINQPVMALTQTQLEEAMKPARFDTHIISIGDQGSSVNDQGIPSSSVLVKDSPFSSATSPINSLLAGEKIQFGAVTSPSILPPSTRGVLHNSRPNASLPLDAQMSQSMSVNNCNFLSEKEKHLNGSCPPLVDCEAEAEAAASAVAVAAIGNDEVVGNGIGSCSIAVTDPKGLGGADITTGMSGDLTAVSQSKAEETLSVSLPADLSVDTPPISMWPALPSPHNSSSQVLSPFPGGPTSHFPFYDMNPMMGGPVFAFGPHEESGGPQQQPQKSSVSSSGPLGTWQQCHSGVDSFYGPPAGFTAPFISPPGSIPGVQGPPHMVVYNHFAPVGQFGQVGLSYMGTTYIPSGKQPDWKCNTTASALGGNEGEMNNANLIPMQRTSPNVPPQVQHLAPGSPLLSMASPLAMFEVSPFQSSPDVTAHSRWSNVQPSSIHTIPQSMPLQQQQQAEGAIPSQSTHGSADHHSLNANGFPKSQTSSTLEERRSFAVVTNTAATQFPDELGLVDPPMSTAPEAVGSKSRSGDSVKVDPAAECSGSKRNHHPHVAVSAPKSAKQKNPSGQQHYNHYHQRGGQRNNSGAEWSNRKTGFQGRNYSSGGERSFPPAKVKQIYVAKQSSTSATGSAV